MLDAPTLRRVLRDFFKFNPKDFFVQSSGTGFLVSSARRIASGGGSNITYGFQYFVAPPNAAGVNPAAPGRFIQLYHGVINANIVPDNMAEVFELANDADSFLQCQTSQNAEGIVTSATLSINSDTAPPDPQGSLGVAPATSTRDLWQFTVANNRIVQAIAFRIGAIEVSRKVVDVTCGQVILQMEWPQIAQVTNIIQVDG